MSLLREHAQDDRGRVTAGIPSLSSERRHQITDRGLMKAYQKALLQDYEGKRADALTSDNGADTTDAEQMAGMVLTGRRIMVRLKRLNPNLWFERSNSDSSKTGIYILRNDLKGGQEKHFLCGMETELNPEFSIRVVDEEGKPKGIVSGWRRVLMRLIRANIISEASAFRLFGPPSRDSENWARFTA